MDEIVVFMGAEALLRVPLERRRLTFGRAPHNTVVVDHPEVAPEHFAIEARAEGWCLVDRTGRGAQLGSMVVSEALLHDGVGIALAPLRAVFRADRGPEQALEGPLFESMVGQSPAMKAVFERIARFAPRRLPVLICGETGVGKELVARALHNRSPRAHRQMVCLNCAELSPGLVESELFGHEKGAFTDAKSASLGKLRAADGGTLFLDELGELPLAMQPKLLRALESGELTPVGASHPVRVDVRAVCATNRDLEAEVEAGRFREDLFHRIAVGIIEVPPLRERGDDLGRLIDHLLVELEPEGGRATLSPQARELLQRHSWPGNVRELKGVLQCALASCRSGRIEVEDVQLRRRGRRAGAGAAPGEPASLGGCSCGPDCVHIAGKSYEAIDREVIARAKQLYGPRMSRVAERLNVKRSTVYGWAKQYGIK